MISPSVISLFSFVWWKGIIIAIIISVIIIQVGIRIPPDKRRVLMVGIGLFMIGLECWQQIYLSKLDLWTIKTSLPIHLCGISGILGAILMWKPNQHGFEFLALIGVPGALHGLLTPQLNHGETTFLIFEYYAGHSGIILVPIFLAVVEGYRVREKSWLNVFIMCQVLLIIIVLINYILDANYMYLSKRPLVNNPMIIGEWPWYVFGFEAIGLIHILILYYGFRKMKPLPF